MTFMNFKMPGTAIMFAFVCTGCSTVDITPEIPAGDVAATHFVGSIQYDGNREYLPRNIGEGTASQSNLTFRYVTAEVQDRSSWDVVAMFNPLTILGFPTGRRTSTITGQLEILKGADVIRAYTATCTQKADRGIYYGESFSELRRRGLLAVRDNIEAQLSRDQDAIVKATSGITRQ